MSFYNFSPVERIEVSIKLCKTNKLINHVKNMEVKGVCVSEMDDNDFAGIILLNPSRSGIFRYISNIHSLIKGHIIYVSCNPLTLKKDLKALNITKYHIKSIIPINQFPNTNHLEVIVHIYKP